MINIYYNTLNKELKKAIYTRALSSEQLKNIYTQIKQKNDKKKKTINIVMICVAFMFILMEILSFSKTDNPEFAKTMLLFNLPIIVIIYVLVYFTQIGIMKIQFNGAIKKNYPELANELQL